MISRAPDATLRPFVIRLWASEPSMGSVVETAGQERVLPTGLMHIAFRLSGRPFQIFANGRDRPVSTTGHAIVGGPRSGAYLRDHCTSSTSVGALLAPGASRALFGVPASALSERHLPLEALVGSAAEALRIRLCEAQSSHSRLDLLESALASHLRWRELHPAVAYALRRFVLTAEVGTVVRETGISHRRFDTLFQESVGLTPKRWCRVLRFRSVLSRLAARTGGSMADLALAAGYSDQPHFNREFRTFADMTPRDYAAFAPVLPHHVQMR